MVLHSTKIKMIKGNYLLTIFILIITVQTSYGQTYSIHNIKEDKWHNFERKTFTFNQHKVWIVQPKKALEGNPWIWKAYFPDWHTSIDSILLSKGFHLAYIEANNLFGSPTAMNIWDQFYTYLVNEKGFAHKVALEGISRGGLYVYNWAKRNPLQVACIYGEAPVLDFKSWPGGKGLSKGSQIDWNLLKEDAGFTEQQATEYKDNPIDHLEGLAACKIPLLHTVGLHDSIVPIAENTTLLFKKYIQLGGSATVYPMTIGKQELQGHHFEIENPEAIANFIQSNSYPVKLFKDAHLYHQNMGTLKNSFLQFTLHKKGRVAFMGGSITEWGAWRLKIEQFLKERFPETQFEFINAGISSTGSLPGAFRFQQDVLSKGKIDLFFEEAAVNDRANSTSSIEQTRAMEGIIRRALLSNSLMDIIVMNFVDPEKLKIYKENDTPFEITNHSKIASYYHTGIINLAKEVFERIEANEFSWENDFKDLHPSLFGQEIYFRSIKTFLNRAYAQNNIQMQFQPTQIPAPLDRHAYFKANYIPADTVMKLNGFEIQPNWLPKDSYETRKQFVHTPVLVAEKSGSELTLNFTGNTIGICVNAGPDAGMISYSIDGSSFITRDLFTKWSGSLHLPWYIILADSLKNKKHTLTIKTLDKKNERSKGNACRIVHFLVNR